MFPVVSVVNDVANKWVYYAVFDIAIAFAIAQCERHLNSVKFVLHWYKLIGELNMQSQM